MCTLFSNVKLGHVIRISRNTLFSRHYKPLLVLNSSNRLSKHQQRQFSLQSSLESLITTQAGFFKSLSESSIVEYSQKFVLSIHDTTGLPWWASIICTTVLLRTAITLPLAVYQYYIIAKLENIKLQMPALVKEIQKEVAVAIKMYKWDEKTAKLTFNRSVKKQWTKLIEQENCHPYKTVILLLFQIPMWISLSVALRNLVYMLPEQNSNAQMTFLELSLGGFGVIPNLTAVDSSYIFPFALGIINLLIIEFQCLSRVDTPSRSSKVITNFFRMLSVLMIPIAASVPSCLVLYWTTSSTYGLLQNILLVSPKVRRICQIPKTVKELEKPYEHVAAKFAEKWSPKFLNKS